MIVNIGKISRESWWIPLDSDSFTRTTYTRSCTVDIHSERKRTVECRHCQKSFKSGGVRLEDFSVVDIFENTSESQVRFVMQLIRPAVPDGQSNQQQDTAMNIDTTTLSNLPLLDIREAVTQNTETLKATRHTKNISWLSTLDAENVLEKNVSAGGECTSEHSRSSGEIEKTRKQRPSSIKWSDPLFGTIPTDFEGRLESREGRRTSCPNTTFQQDPERSWRGHPRRSKKDGNNR